MFDSLKNPILLLRLRIVSQINDAKGVQPTLVGKGNADCRSQWRLETILIQTSLWESGEIQKKILH